MHLLLLLLHSRLHRIIFRASCYDANAEGGLRKRGRGGWLSDFLQNEVQLEIFEKEFSLIFVVSHFRVTLIEL